MVPEILCDITDKSALFQQTRRASVAQGMRADVLQIEAKGAQSFPNGLPDNR